VLLHVGDGDPLVDLGRGGDGGRLAGDGQAHSAATFRAYWEATAAGDGAAGAAEMPQRSGFGGEKKRPVRCRVVA
jgi:hypothetical protein